MTVIHSNDLERGWLHPRRGRQESAYWRALRALGSPRLALGLLLLLLGGVVWTYLGTGPAVWPMVVPLALCCVNLLAAVGVHPAFRRHGALLMFHLALVAIVVLAALGRLTYLSGHMELSQGERFGGRLAGFQAGPWHPWGIRDVRFSNEGFTIDYKPGRRRDHTYNRVSYVPAQGRTRQVIIGDQVPLTLEGYRFYTTFNKGFALNFAWAPRGGAPRHGTVHLPAYPIHEYRQANTWTPPGTSRELWIQLQFDEPLLDPQGPARFRAPGSHRVVVRDGDRRVELNPGSSFEIEGGRVTYEGVSTWMGYKVFYDWTIPWLLAACVVAVTCLGWHFWQKYAQRPWWLGDLGAQEGI